MYAYTVWIHQIYCFHKWHFPLTAGFICRILRSRNNFLKCDKVVIGGTQEFLMGSFSECFFKIFKIWSLISSIHAQISKFCPYCGFTLYFHFQTLPSLEIQIIGKKKKDANCRHSYEMLILMLIRVVISLPSSMLPVLNF